MVNTFQTILFLSFGSVTIVVIGYGMGGFAPAVEGMLAEAKQAVMLTREKVSPAYFFSYMFIPLSSIAFPHMAIFCLTAKKMAAFRKTVVLYPLCIMAVWLPSVFLGVMANRATEVPGIQAKLEARAALPGAAPEQREQLQRQAAGDDVLLLLLEQYAPLWLAGLLGAGIMAAVMASDSQILALSTMVTEDLFAFYGGKERFGEVAQVFTGRAFVVGVTVVATLWRCARRGRFSTWLSSMHSRDSRHCVRCCGRRCTGGGARNGELWRRRCGRWRRWRGLLSSRRW